jgi:hypothetical protein
MLLKDIARDLGIDTAIVRRIIWQPVRDRNAEGGGE